MTKFGILGGALAALLIAGCGGKDPASSPQEQENPGHQSDGPSAKVYVRLGDPDPDQMVAQVISYPYDLRFVPREQAPVPEGAVWSMFTTEGKLLAQAGTEEAVLK
jgi:hypothetical protein